MESYNVCKWMNVRIILSLYISHTFCNLKLNHACQWLWSWPSLCPWTTRKPPTLLESSRYQAHAFFSNNSTTINWNAFFNNSPSSHPSLLLLLIALNMCQLLCISTTVLLYCTSKSINQQPSARPFHQYRVQLCRQTSVDLSSTYVQLVETMSINFVAWLLNNSLIRAAAGLRWIWFVIKTWSQSTNSKIGCNSMLFAGTLT